MTKLDWNWPLEAGEVLRWQGRPAPRCYTFRNWKQVAIATLLFLTSSFWTMLGFQLVIAEGHPFWLVLIPAPIVLGSLWFGPISLLLARLRWEKVFYALTERRLLVRDGQFKPGYVAVELDDLQAWQQKRHGKHLASLRLHCSKRSPLVLYCLEHPQQLLELLPCEEKTPVAKGAPGKSV